MAKEIVLTLAKDYQAPKPAGLVLPGLGGKLAIQSVVQGYRMTGKISKHDALIANVSQALSIVIGCFFKHTICSFSIAFQRFARSCSSVRNSFLLLNILFCCFLLCQLRSIILRAFDIKCHIDAASKTNKEKKHW